MIKTKKKFKQLDRWLGRLIGALIMLSIIELNLRLLKIQI